MKRETSNEEGKGFTLCRLIVRQHLHAAQDSKRLDSKPHTAVLPEKANDLKEARKTSLGLTLRALIVRQHLHEARNRERLFQGHKTGQDQTRILRKGGLKQYKGSTLRRLVLRQHLHEARNCERLRGNDLLVVRLDARKVAQSARRFFLESRVGVGTEQPGNENCHRF